MAGKVAVIGQIVLSAGPFYHYCVLAGPDYVRVSSGSCTSQGHADVTNMADCEAAAAALGLSDTNADDQRSISGYALTLRPPHCGYASNNYLLLNSVSATGACGQIDTYRWDCICAVATTVTTAPTTVAETISYEVTYEMYGYHVDRVKHQSLHFHVANTYTFNLNHYTMPEKPLVL